MKKFFVLIALIGIVTMGFTGKPLVEKKISPKILTTEWYCGNSTAVATWETFTVGWITVSGGSVISTESYVTNPRPLEYCERITYSTGPLLSE